MEILVGGGRIKCVEHWTMDFESVNDCFVLDTKCVVIFICLHMKSRIWWYSSDETNQCDRGHTLEIDIVETSPKVVYHNHHHHVPTFFSSMLFCRYPISIPWMGHAKTNTRHITVRSSFLSEMARTHGVAVHLFNRTPHKHRHTHLISEDFIVASVERHLFSNTEPAYRLSSHSPCLSSTVIIIYSLTTDPIMIECFRFSPGWKSKRKHTRHPPKRCYECTHDILFRYLYLFIYIFIVVIQYIRCG